MTNDVLRTVRLGSRSNLEIQLFDIRNSVFGQQMANIERPIPARLSAARLSLSDGGQVPAQAGATQAGRMTNGKRQSIQPLGSSARRTRSKLEV
jgi:hypothetical protein